MKNLRRGALVAVISSLGMLTGCFRVTRSVQKSHPPSTVMSTSLDALVKQISQRYDSFQTLNASVDMLASSGGNKNGKVEEVNSLSGYILSRKPSDLRVILYFSIAHIKSVDMVTNGKTFTLSIPPKSRWITGTDQPTSASKNPLENLRPYVFADSLFVAGPTPGQLVSLTADERVYRPDDNKRDLIDEPTYELSFHTPVPNSNELKTTRTVHIGRANLLPFQQDIYDTHGQLDVQATYDNYQDFNGVQFPSKITIRRPKDQLSLVLTVNKLTTNQPMEDDQFELKVPDNAKLEKLP